MSQIRNCRVRILIIIVAAQLVAQVVIAQPVCWQARPPGRTLALQTMLSPADSALSLTKQNMHRQIDPHPSHCTAIATEMMHISDRDDEYI